MNTSFGTVGFEAIGFIVLVIFIFKLIGVILRSRGVRELTEEELLEKVEHLKTLAWPIAEEAISLFAPLFRLADISGERVAYPGIAGEYFRASHPLIYRTADISRDAVDVTVGAYEYKLSRFVDEHGKGTYSVTSTINNEPSSERNLSFKANRGTIVGIESFRGENCINILQPLKPLPAAIEEFLVLRNQKYREEQKKEEHENLKKRFGL